jgi:two-component system cell cycle sensor histidine kinase/response regulator CckA
VDGYAKHDEVTDSLATNGQNRLGSGLDHWLHHLPVAAYACDAAGLLTDCNDAAVRLWGRRPKLHDPADRYCGAFRLFALDGHPIRHEDCPMADALRTGVDRQGEIGIECPDGRRLIVQANIKVLCDANGKVAGAANVLIDVTERKQAEETLRRNHEELRACFAQSIDGCFCMMLDEPVRWNDDIDKERTLDFVFAHQRITEINDAMLAQYGATRDEMLGVTPAEIFLHDLAHGRDLWRRFFDAGKVRLISDERRRDGTPIWIEGEYVALYDREGRITGHFGIQRDITDQRQMVSELAAEQRRYSGLVNKLDGIVWEVDAQSYQFRFVSPQAERILGYPLRDWLEVPSFWQDHIHPDDRNWAIGFCVDSTQRLQDHSFEYRMIAADGRIVWFHDAVTVEVVDGAPATLRGVMVDITDRKRVEHALRESEERLRAVVSNTPNVAIQWYDRDGRVRMWNDASVAMFGFTAAEAVGQTLDQLIHTPEETATFLATLANIGRTGACLGPTEYTFRRRNGEPGVCLSSLFRIPGDDRGDWFVCMDVDITERKRAEEERRRLEAQILHSQKLESLGVLAGGIAHDFNNLLTAVMGNAGLAQLQLPEESPVRSLLNEVERAARRAAELTSQMLAYAGKGQFHIQPLQLDCVVREMTELLATVVSKKARFDFDLQPARTAGDATQIRQIVMNLLTNASDALDGEAGAIVVRTRVRALSASELRSPYLPDQLPAGEYALLEVEDTGSGMSNETLHRLFDPFYTTKFTGRGLGLAAVLGIVRSHRGTIQVTSVPDRGTLFLVCLPLAPDECAGNDDCTGPVPQSSGRGTVLIVEDEATVRLLAQRILESDGFHVRTAENGHDGLATFDRYRADIVAVLVDLTMPSMDGAELLQHIRQRDATMPVLMMSGYSETDVAQRLPGTSSSGFIGKPFQPDELLSRVKQSLPTAGGR